MFLHFWEKRIILVFLKKFLVISDIAPDYVSFLMLSSSSLMLSSSSLLLAFHHEVEDCRVLSPRVVGEVAGYVGGGEGPRGSVISFWTSYISCVPSAVLV